MDVIIGGVYQGKLDYARTEFSLSDEDIYECVESEDPDWSRRCICHLERYVRRCVERGMSRNTPYRPDAVLIADDIACGIVPMDAVEREWREENGRCMAKLAREADTVTRVFCGLPLKLK